MKKLLLLLALLTTCSLADTQVKGHVDMQVQSYLTKPSGKHPQNYTASSELELTHIVEEFEFIAKLYAQQDYYDLKGSSEHNDRSFLRLDEMYLKYDGDTSQILVGKSIRFWGALEVDNITDSFNPDDFRSDIFDADKLGTWNVSYTHYTDTGEIALIVKVDEQDRKMPAYPYVYYFFPEYVNYDSDLDTEHSANQPSVFLKYSDSTDSDTPLDFSIILEHGYDSQRYIDPINYQEHAYIVNKLSTYNTLVVGDTLYKLEAVYADVLNDKQVSDYYHIGLGIEHTLTRFHDSADLGLLTEYYKYETLQDGKLNDLQLFESFQNDLFLGIRYSFNEGKDASIVTGVVFDLDYNEQNYYIEYESRIADTFKLNFDYRYIEPSKNDLTTFNLMGRHQRVSLKLGYYF